jgi:hypothetical protein
MKKQVVIFVVGIVTLIVGYVVHSFTLAEECQKPNSNTIGCADPTNEVSACTAEQGEQCEGKALYTEPVQKPDGTTKSDSGTTSTTRIDCIKQYNCHWTPPFEDVPGECSGEPDWDIIAYDKTQKIIVGENICPEG